MISFWSNVSAMTTTAAEAADFWLGFVLKILAILAILAFLFFVYYVYIASLSLQMPAVQQTGLFRGLTFLKKLVFGCNCDAVQQRPYNY